MGGGRGVRVLLACIIDEQIHVTNKVLSGEYVILTSSRDIPQYAIQLIHGSSASHGQMTMLRDDDVTCCSRSNDGPAKRRHCCDGDHCAF